MALPRRLRWHWRLSRDSILFVFGLGGIIHETLLQAGPERPSLLVLFAACIGLPAFLTRDEHKRIEPKDDPDRNGHGP
jgi:hypothetical protein